MTDYPQQKANCQRLAVRLMAESLLPDRVATEDELKRMEAVMHEWMRTHLALCRLEKEDQLAPKAP